MSWTPPALLSEYTERQWQAVIEEAAAYLGYPFAYHTHDSRKSDEGFPDLVLVKPGVRVIYFECKTDKPGSKPTQKQVDWVRALRSTGAHAWIVRPRNVDFVLDVLRGTIPPPPFDGGPDDPFFTEHRDAVEAVLDNELKVKRRYPSSARRRSRAMREGAP